MDRQYESTIAKTAKVFGVNSRTIREWLERGAPGKTKDGYDIEAIRNWRELNLKQPSGNSEIEAIAGAVADDIQQAVAALKLRKLIAEVLEVEAKAELKQFDVTQKTQEVVHLDDVDNWVSGLLTELRRLILRLPKEMSAGYPVKTRRKIEEDLELRMSLILRSLEGYATRSTELRDGSM